MADGRVEIEKKIKDSDTEAEENTKNGKVYDSHNSQDEIYLAVTVSILKTVLDTPVQVQVHCKGHDDDASTDEAYHFVNGDYHELNDSNSKVSVDPV